MSFCPSINHQNCPLHFPLSSQTQQYQFNGLNPSFPLTHVYCQPSSIVDTNKLGNHSSQTSSLTYRLLNALSSIYKPFSIPITKTNDKCLPLLHELFRDMINQYTITIDEVQNEIDYLSDKIPKKSC